MASSFNVNVHDLQYILKQIKIAEDHAGGKTLLQAIMDAYGTTAANAAQLPAGLRTVDGSLNSLVAGQENFGAADMLFPRLTDPVYQTVDGPGIDFNGDGIVDVINHNYGDTNGPAPGGTRSVADTDPRVISNLIVDMSVTNPAAIYTFLSNPLSVGAFEADMGFVPTVAWFTDAANVAAGNAWLLQIPNQSPDIGLSPGFNSWMTFFGQFFDHGLDLVTKGSNGTVYIPLMADDPLYDEGKDGIANNVVDAYFVTDPALAPVGGPLPAVSGAVTVWQAFYVTDPADRSLYAPGAFAPVITATPTAFAVRFNDDGFGADGMVGTADDSPNFMALTRATVTLDANGVPQYENTTTSFVDQNQTYTSHSSHQVFLRDYVLRDVDGVGGNGPVAVSTGKLLDGALAGSIGNWGEVKAQALTMLGIKLDDFDVHNVPLLLTDQYGKFIPGANGFAQIVMKPDLTHATVWYKEGNPDGSVTTAGSVGTGHAFLNDIAHHAAPKMYDANGDGFKESRQTADTDPGVGDDGLASTYDDEMLNAHFVTGDGRGNENIALTTVHSIFHSEHNRLVGANKATLLENAGTPAGLAFLNEWLVVDVVAGFNPATLVWDGERLFQAARFATEMQYQHLVFEEFARRMQPMVDPFIFNNSPDVNPSILAEFANTVYRFGHSMLTGTVDRLENDLTTVNGDASQATLLATFLNPQAYLASGVDIATINANIIRGLSRDVGNEIDEFIVTDVRSQLLGLPLDLGALNIARGRETGVPSLNDTRAQLYNDFGIVDLKPYASWAEFALAIKNPMSVINFIAAYGTHASILAATTVADKRVAAFELVIGTDVNGGGVAADRLAFLNATGAYAGGKLGGLNNIDLWIGGLAEKKMEFGGMLGSTFNFIFEYQMENLQNGDRLYYLTRTQGLNILNNLEPNTMTDMVMRNTALGDTYATHLSGALFITPDHIIELDRGIAQEDYNGAAADLDPLWEGLDPVTEAIIGPKVVRDYTGATTLTVGTTVHDVGGYLRVLGGEHYVLGGTEGNDTLLGDSGIDALWGDGGDDYLNAGTESDDVFGGEGDDLIEDPFGDDVLRGDHGNDVISSARGADLLFGDEGNDYIIMGQDAAETFGGEGDDFILGGNGKDFILGNEGNDWIEGGGGFETIAGENSELFFNSTVIGHDVMFGQADETDYDAESGDDIMGSGASVYRYEGQFGFDWAMGKGDFTTTGVNFDFQIPIFTTIPNDVLKDRFDQVEAASGWAYNDYLQGDDRGHKGGGSSSPDSVPTELFAEHLLTQDGINRINGLNEWFGSTGGVMDTTDARYTLFGGLSPVPGSTASSTFRDGNILMGGDGDDILRGRGGYDLLDGDAYLNVRIKIVVGGITYSAESMSTDTAAMGQYAGKVFNTNADGTPDFTSVAFGGRSLNSLMLDRTINPGNMSIVREILTDSTSVTGAGSNIDTALYQGTREEYDIEGITQVVDLNGTAPDTLRYEGTATDLDGDGFISVRDRDTGAIGATVWRIIDGVATQVSLGTSRGMLTDDRDLLKNVEQLQFADQMVTIGGSNALATGTVTISDATPFDGRVTPYVGQVLTASLTNVVDADGIPLDANNLPVGLNFIWQTTEVGSNSGWSDIQTSHSYTVRSVDPGHILRAVAVFKDANGHNERILSDATDNPTTAFRVLENSVNGAIVGLQIPFNVDYDSQSINGAPPPDVDITTLYHEIDPANDSDGRFTVVANGVDFNGKPRFSLVVADGGPTMLNYEAPVHTPANQSFQFVDNQYQVVINTYSANPANGGTLVAVRQFTVLLDDVTGEPVNIAPTLDLAAPVTITTTTTGQYLDNFNTQSLSNTNGSTPWTTPWVETGDNGGTNSASAGQIQIDVATIGNQMRFGDNDTDVGNGTATIQRTVNLAGVTSATLSYSFAEIGFDAGEIVTVTFSANGSFDANNTQMIQTLNGDSNNGSTSVNLSTTTTAPFTANAAIRFVVSGTNNNSTIPFLGIVTDFVTIDNLNIATITTTTTIDPGTVGNDYATTYIENAAAVAIASGPIIVDLNSPQMMTATVKLTNAQAGDMLSVAGSLPGGITSSFGPAVAGQITMYLSGPASLAAFQTAIAAVRFGNPAENNPVAGVRTISVSVNDGEVDSNFATASVTVVAVNDVFSAGSDRIITNIGNVANGIIVPEWVLLANDSDPDGPAGTAAITGVSGFNSLTASLAPVGSVSVTDTGAANGGTFNYAASWSVGAQTATGAVSVQRDTSNGTISGSDTFDDILIGDGQNTIFDGGEGNDFVFAGAGNDTINWNASGSNGPSDGRDYVDGGVGTVDRFVVNGNNNAETFNVYARTDAIGAGFNGLKADTEIVVTRDGIIIAELDNIEDITINTGGGTDTVNAIGNFNPTSLAFNTIHVNSGSGNTTVDISDLTSAHRVVLTGNGGDDRIIGNVRPQDVVLAGTVSDDDGPEDETEERETDHHWASRRAEVMSGSNDEDWFHFTSVKSARRDTILNFEPGDKIDLSAIDANGSVRGNQSFTLVTGGLHERGDLMVTEEMRSDGVYTIVSGNTHGNARAEFKFAIKGSHDLDGTDFVF